MQYIHTYATQNDYDLDDGKGYPNVGYVEGDDVVIYMDEEPITDWSKQYLTFEAISAGTFSFNKPCSYSMDRGNTWTSLGTNESTPTVNAGEKIMFKHNETSYGSTNYPVFSATADFNAMGNPYSIISGDSFTAVTSVPQYGLKGLFSGNTHIISAENLKLPLMTLNAVNCYEGMFSGCTSLTTAPELPAATLSSYCYECMFAGCTSLTTAPALSSTSLASRCYEYMFKGCTSLTTAPALPATSLTANCYSYMFAGCTSLKNAPVLNASKLVSYCYSHMFEGCTSLSYIKMICTSGSTNSALNSWVKNVSSRGTFVKKRSMSLSTGISGIPSGWTVSNVS